MSLTYVLDTNVFSDILKQNRQVIQTSAEKLRSGATLLLCQPVYYEIRRGLLWRKAHTQLRTFDTNLKPLYQWYELGDTDWNTAAVFWAESVSKGRQLDDTDLLIAAIAKNASAIIVSSDKDFDAINITRENWREPT